MGCSPAVTTWARLLSGRCQRDSQACSFAFPLRGKIRRLVHSGKGSDQHSTFEQHLLKARCRIFELK